MKGMEMMLANMLGLKPDQMQAMMTGFAEMAETGVETFKRIEAQNVEILARLERLENGNGKRDG
jgi:hypothetical protein